MNTESSLVFCQSSNEQPKDFQVFGERCSGTNFLEHLLKTNFRLKCVYHYGWKHGVPTMPAISHTSLIVVVVRNPLEWLVKLYNTPYEAHPSMYYSDFSQFIRAEWEAISRPGIQGWSKWGMRQDGKLKGEVFQLDRHPELGRRFKNVLEMRKVKARAMLGFRHRTPNVAVLRFEDLRDRPEQCLEELSTEFNLQSKHMDWKMVDERVDPKPAHAKPIGFTVENISETDLNFICGELSFELEKELGYETVFAQRDVT